MTDGDVIDGSRGVREHAKPRPVLAADGRRPDGAYLAVSSLAHASFGRLAVGVSTSCCPGLSSAELADRVRASGGSCVELRAGKGHAWEREGIDSVLAEGIDISAVSSSITLGSGGNPAQDESVSQAAAASRPLRSFLDIAYEQNAATRDRALAQASNIQARLGRREALLIEPHPGAASVATVATFCDLTGATAVCDTYAIHRVGMDTADALALLGAHAVVLHLKGFARSPTIGGEHRPLATSDLPSSASLASATALSAVIVETRAGSHWDDVALVAGWANVRGRSQSATKTGGHLLGRRM